METDNSKSKERLNICDEAFIFTPPAVGEAES